MIIEAIVLIIGGGIISVFILDFLVKVSIMNKNKEVIESITFLLKKGIEIVHSSKHLYGSKDKYTILFFNKHGDLKQPVPEENFDTAEEAVNRFVNIIGDKLE